VHNSETTSAPASAPLQGAPMRPVGRGAVLWPPLWRATTDVGGSARDAGRRNKCRPGSEERRGVARLRAAPRNQASAGLSMDDWWVARAWGVGVGQTPPRLRAPRKSGPKCALNYSAPAPTPVWVRRPGTWPLGHVRSGRAMGVDVPRRPGRHAAPDNVEA